MYVKCKYNIKNCNLGLYVKYMYNIKNCLTLSNFGCIQVYIGTKYFWF